MKIYNYIPIKEHPLIPNFPLHYSITKKQYEELKKGPDMTNIAASVVKDPTMFEDSAEELL